MTPRHPRLLLGTTLAVLAATLVVACNKAPDSTAAAPRATMGAQVDDTVITTSVKAALLADPGIKSMDIGVVTSQGEVQLTGFVSNQDQIDQANQIARTTEGARSVKNELRIKL